ncbi:YfdX family protein [Acetobacteraceae bacterium KSS8]|uniref:YfdX family protein n=1 Tax=Endosaccharibacter trunci TaxID=2812733 RepID=A0ABT1W4F3_9PROT|nr:YfdX family protein [Acetobacteraceae bacterium KSS8]
MLSQKRTALIAAALCLTASAAFATEQAPAMSPAQSAANEDFGMLSTQGAIAFHDVRLARLAIFEGRTGVARQLVSTAETAFQKARSDVAAYNEAESDLTPPPGVTQKTGGDDGLTGKVKWLPVDGAMTLDENYIATPDKQASLSKADQQIKAGDRKGAMDTLRLAGINVSFDMEVVPLERSISKTQDALNLLKDGHYYEANQTLKSLEDGARFDVATFHGTPKPATAAAQSATMQQNKAG